MVLWKQNKKWTQGPSVQLADSNLGVSQPTPQQMLNKWHACTLCVKCSPLSLFHKFTESWERKRFFGRDQLETSSCVCKQKHVFLETWLSRGLRRKLRTGSNWPQCCWCTHVCERSLWFIVHNRRQLVLRRTSPQGSRSWRINRQLRSLRSPITTGRVHISRMILERSGVQHRILIQTSLDTSFSKSPSSASMQSRYRYSSGSRSPLNSERFNKELTCC